MIRDMMPNFELLQPTKLADALTLLDRRGKDIWKMAGGNDSLDWFKDRVKRPKAVMDLGGIAELKGIRETADGIEIGALTTLADIASSKVIREKFKVLADAAGRVASPQIRNASSIGGNVSQDARCWYYRSGLPCYRAGGNTWDFALVNVASALKVTNGTIDAARVACGGVSCTPRFIKVVEDVVKGGKQDEETAELAGKTATHGARPVTYNQFKIPMMENLVKRAIRDAG